MDKQRKRNWIYEHRAALLIALTFIVFFALFSYGPIPQLGAYNNFASDKTWFGLPHAENVISNLPFLLIGLWGFFRLPQCEIESDLEKLLWMGFFLGVTLIAFGSSYYHLKPDNARLIWDRIPIVFSFMCLFAAVLAERVSLRFAAICILPLIIYSIGSVIYWYITENQGHGDLRPYILVQMLPIILIPVLTMLYEPKYTLGIMLFWAACWYVLAKVFEAFDGVIYNWSGIFGGHSIKHLLAAMACVQVYIMLKNRKLIKK